MEKKSRAMGEYRTLDIPLVFATDRHPSWLGRRVDKTRQQPGQASGGYTLRKSRPVDGRVLTCVKFLTSVLDKLPNENSIFSCGEERDDLIVWYRIRVGVDMFEASRLETVILGTWVLWSCKVREIVEKLPLVVVSLGLTLSGLFLY
ncbi:hypothetical protein TNCV_4469451 [Trichonephila clavipes]|nr:hypothetical protein TNCV_4469451 [Trichonephila clavipes]